MSKLSHKTKKRLKKELNTILEELKGKDDENKAIIVEGIKDKRALKEIGLNNVYTLHGDVRRIARFLKEKGIKKAYILTDFDRRGKELAEKIKGELTAQAIDFDLEKRKRFGAILNIKYWETAEKKLEKFLEKIEGE